MLYIHWCHVLYINAMFYIFMPCFIYLCQFQYIMHHSSFFLHQDFNYCCIVLSHLCCINTNLCCINTSDLCCIFQSPHTVQRYHHLQEPVVLPTLQQLILHGITTRNGVVFANHLDIFLYIVSWGSVAHFGIWRSWVQSPVGSSFRNFYHFYCCCQLNTTCWK